MIAYFYFILKLFFWIHQAAIVRARQLFRQLRPIANKPMILLQETATRPRVNQAAATAKMKENQWLSMKKTTTRQKEL
jgi:hypothetical protein